MRKFFFISSPPPSSGINYCFLLGRLLKPRLLPAYKHIPGSISVFTTQQYIKICLLVVLLSWDSTTTSRRRTWRHTQRRYIIIQLESLINFDHNCNTLAESAAAVHAVVLDFKKAFDKVPHRWLVDEVRNLPPADDPCKLLCNLYPILPSKLVTMCHI